MHLTIPIVPNNNLLPNTALRSPRKCSSSLALNSYSSTEKIASDVLEYTTASTTDLCQPNFGCFQECEDMDDKNLEQKIASAQLIRKEYKKSHKFTWNSGSIETAVNSTCQDDAGYNCTNGQSYCTVPTFVSFIAIIIYLLRFRYHSFMCQHCPSSCGFCNEWDKDCAGSCQGLDARLCLQMEFGTGQWYTADCDESLYGAFCIFK
uniref:Uncharacterized protein n=1 Tax=Acrobeloides nanus TaxID=290746 RepID=A0A914CMH1_9BILA